MKYAHIGLEDQAKAVAALPNPCQRIVSISGDSGGHREPQAIAERHGDGVEDVDETLDGVSLSDAQMQSGASDDSETPEWRQQDVS